MGADFWGDLREAEPKELAIPKGIAKSQAPKSNPFVSFSQQIQTDGKIVNSWAGRLFPPTPGQDSGGQLMVALRQS